jgi:type II secretory pathway pseudopilin PulG
MGNLSPISKRHAFTVIELLVVIVIIVFFAGMLLPSFTGGPRRSNGSYCLNNQRQIGLVLLLFNSDHEGKYPWQLSVTNGGSMESISGGHVFPHIRSFAGYLSSNDARLYVCPADKERRLAASPTSMNDENISYFLNIDVFATSNTANFALTGDRQLQTNGHAVKPGLLGLSTELNLNWTQPAVHRSGGILGFVDGHVQFVKTNALDAMLQFAAASSNRLCVP